MPQVDYHLQRAALRESVRTRRSANFYKDLWNPVGFGISLFCRGFDDSYQCYWG